MSECQEHEGYRNNSGYGVVYVGSKRIMAHRLAWALHNGADPAGKVVMHSCDNRACVNPEHLSLGTYKDNTADMVKKGRARYVAHPGKSNGKARLTEDQVWYARRLIADGVSNQAIGSLLGVTHQNINRIRKGLTWQSLR